MKDPKSQIYIETYLSNQETSSVTFAFFAPLFFNFCLAMLPFSNCRNPFHFFLFWIYFYLVLFSLLLMCTQVHSLLTSTLHLPFVFLFVSFLLPDHLHALLIGKVYPFGDVLHGGILQDFVVQAQVLDLVLCPFSLRDKPLVFVPYISVDLELEGNFYLNSILTSML